MGKKYHFRKMHFICYKNKVINQFLTFVNAYKDRDHAEKVLAEKTTKRFSLPMGEARGSDPTGKG